MKILNVLAATLLAAVLFTPRVTAEPENQSDLTRLTYESDTQGTSVSLQEVREDYVLFLPSCAKLTELSLLFEGETAVLTVDDRSIAITSGEPFDLTELYPDVPSDGVYAFTVSQNSQELPVKIMMSKNIASMYLTSADPEEKGRLWVDSDKENKASGKMTLLGSDGSVIYSDDLKQIKGRGNSTWKSPKKPYQIKLANAADLIETGEEKEAEKTWILLANYLDASFIRNSLFFDMAAEMGVAYSPNSRPVDLYYDGEYRGTYLLSEKTEVGDGRVDIHNLEKDFEDANPQADDFDNLPVAKGNGAYGNEYQYVEGLSDPDDISGGYLLELEFSSRASDEKSYFVTTHDSYIVSKSPEYLSQNAMEYISNFYQEFEDTLAGDGVNPDTGKSYSDYVDPESLAKCYLIQELSQDLDVFASSSYFYKHDGEDKLYAGPVWDFDLTYERYYTTDDINELRGLQTYLGRKLLDIPSFCQIMQDICRNELNQIVTNVVLSADSGAQQGRLRSIDGYSEEVSVSKQMDNFLWAESVTENYEDTVGKLRDTLFRRNEALYNMCWMSDERTLQFVDVPKDVWYSPAVEYVVSKNIFAGVSSHLFGPEKVVTRAMAAAILYNMAGTPDIEGITPFEDVPENAWCAKAVAWTAENGIFYGYDDGLFDPNGILTRQEFATVLYNYARNLGCDVTAPELPDGFVDRDSVAYWAEDAFAWVVDRGIMSGTDMAELLPDSHALRYMAASMIQRYDNVISSEIIQ